MPFLILDDHQFDSGNADNFINFVRMRSKGLHFELKSERHVDDLFYGSD